MSHSRPTISASSIAKTSSASHPIPSNQPVKINEHFICQACGHSNPPAHSTCRNHCRKCLYSLHVDLKIPGDRASQCYGLLEPIGLDQNAKKGFVILHKCLKCAYENRNFQADDDDFNALIKLSHRQNLQNL